MTGYHAWVFPFIALVFHLSLFLQGLWSWMIEARIVGSIMLFWVAEDFLWFVMNPAYGIARFTPAHVAWHKHWWHGAPTDYWLSITIAILLLSYTYWREEPR